MVKTYKAYVSEDGHLTAYGATIKLPTACRITVDVPDDETAATQAHVDNRQKRLAAIREAINNAAAAENELTDAEWEELANIREQTNAGLARNIDL